MIQRYYIEHTKDFKLIEDKDAYGPYVKWDDYQKLTEWKLLTAECKPLPKTGIYIWIKGDECPQCSYLELFFDEYDLLFPSKKRISDVLECGLEIKWKYSGANPWEK